MRSAANCPYAAMYILPSDGFTARLGSVTVLVQQLVQKLTPPLHDAQDKIVAIGIFRRQVSRVHKTMNVAFSSTSCFKQRLFGCAFQDVFSDELPPLFLPVPNGVVGEFRCVDQGVEIGMRGRCVQSGLSQRLRLCRRLSCAHLIACCWLAYRFQFSVGGHRDHKARRLREEAIALTRHAHQNALVIQLSLPRYDASFRYRRRRSSTRKTELFKIMAQP